MSWLSHIYGAVSQLLDEGYWLSADAEDAVQEIENLLAALSEVGTVSDGVPVGTIVAVANDVTPPDDWLKCQGQTLDASVYPDLYAVVGDVYGGGGGFFNIPNLAGRIPFGSYFAYPIASEVNFETGASTLTVGGLGLMYWIKAE